MASVTENQYQAEFLVSEAEGTRSREQVTVLTGQNLQAGHVIGKVTKAGTTTVTADANNAGDGAMGAIVVGNDAKPGRYVLTVVDPAANAGAFVVEDPDGINIGEGDVGVAFNAGGLQFTLADGGNDFAAGDQIFIDVDAGSGKVVEHDPAAADGSEVAAGILLAAVDATGADAAGVTIERDAEVNLSELVFKAGMTQDEKDAAVADLKALGVIAR